MNLTPWFPDHTVPDRCGYYETRRPNLYGMARVARRTAVGGVRREKPEFITITLYWSGRAWLASKHSDNSSLFIQRREWRGVMFSHAKTYTTKVGGRLFTKLRDDE